MWVLLSRWQTVLPEYMVLQRLCRVSFWNSREMFTAWFLTWKRTMSVLFYLVIRRISARVIQ